MRFVLASASLLIANLYALQREQPPSPSRELDDFAQLLDPIQIENVTVIPIVTTGPTRVDHVLTLDEAMSDHRLRVTELAADDALEFANAADQPVLVLAGEVLLGGTQDRVIATTTLIPPHSTHGIAVRSVERDHWSSGEIISAGRLAHDRLRGIAAYADQKSVSDEVARLNEAHFTKTVTGTYRDLAELQPAMTSYREELLETALDDLPDADRERLIGFAVAYNGELAAIDFFRSPALFTKLRHELAQSYFAEGIERRDDNPTNDKAPCIHAIRDFIANARRGNVERAHWTAMGFTAIQRGTRTASSRVEVGRVPLYSSYQRNEQTRFE